MASQLVRAASSGSASYAEACGAESLADFIHKLAVANKELRDGGFPARVANRAGFRAEKPKLDFRIAGLPPA
jgi:four helix bundle protein